MIDTLGSALVGGVPSTRLPQQEAMQIHRSDAVAAVGAGQPADGSSNGLISDRQQVSDLSAAASDLLDEANRFVRAKAQAAFTAYDEGRVTPGAYIDVGRFNDAIIDFAADQMVQKSKQAGLDLSKADVATAIREANRTVFGAGGDDQARVDALGKGSVYTELTAGDLEALTSVMIDLSLHDQDTGAVEGLAFDIGVARRFNGLHDDAPAPIGTGGPRGGPSAPLTASIATSGDEGRPPAAVEASLDRWGFSTAVARFLTARAGTSGDSTTRIIDSLRLRSSEPA